MILDKRATSIRAKVSQPIVNGETMCTRCKVVKPIKEFRKAPHILRGFEPHCKTCKCAESQAQRDRIKEGRINFI